MDVKSDSEVEVVARDLSDVLRLDVVRQFAGQVELVGETLVVQTPSERWNYAVGLPVRLERLADADWAAGPALFTFEVVVHSGRVGLACANRDQTAFLDQVTLETAPEPLTVEMSVHDLRECSAVIVRNESPTGNESLISIRAARVRRPGSAHRDRLYAVYDLNWMPLSFDFITFMMDAEMARVRRGLGSLHPLVILGGVETVPRADPRHDKAVDRHSRLWRIHHLLAPMVALFPSVGGFRLIDRRYDAMADVFRWPHLFPSPTEFGKRDMAAMFRSLMEGLASEARCRRPKASEQGRRYVRQWLATHCGVGRDCVAITLRDADYSPERNSDKGAWGSFVNRLDRNRFAPFFIPDTDTAMLGPPPELAGIPWFAEASFNVGLRMAANELAYLNLLSSGGPSNLCAFNPDVRYLYLKQIVAGVHEASEDHLRTFGHRPGHNVPFAGPFQKWVWEDDTLDAIEREFHTMVARIDAGAY